MRYAINWRAFKDMMTAPGADEKSALRDLHASAIIEVGDMGNGEGWRAYEELIKQQVREHIFSKEQLFKRVMEGE